MKLKWTPSKQYQQSLYESERSCSYGLFHAGDAAVISCNKATVKFVIITD